MKLTTYGLVKPEVGTTLVWISCTEIETELKGDIKVNLVVMCKNVSWIKLS
jgi:hypothetical protein